ncbi:threonine dehydrogenase-like Zn-dependent dehydrogenase [Streptomyces sp. V4I8]
MSARNCSAVRSRGSMLRLARHIATVPFLYVDPEPEYRALARAFGAATAASLEPLPQGYDIAVEATGRVGQLALAVKCLTPEGMCESAGNHFGPGELPLLDM